MDIQKDFNEQFTEIIKTIGELAEEDGFDDYWFYNQCLQGDYIVESFFEEYYKQKEGLSCCSDKASFTLNKIKEMIAKKQIIPLQETYKQYQENGGDIGGITDLNKIAYWCPKTIKDSKEAIELFYKNVVRNKTEKLEHEIKVKDEALREFGQVVKDMCSDKQSLIDKLEKDIINITETMKDGKHWDDYSRCRLKAYRTKTKEILSILKGEKYE